MITASYSAVAASVPRPEQLGHPAELRSHHGLAVDDANRRAIRVGRQRAAPLLGRVRRIRA